VNSKQFWRTLVHKSSGCWEWPLAKSQGYGIVYIDGVRKYTHRFASEQKRGFIPDGIQVLHRCDNPPCCRPGHLFRGTDLDNRRDQISKGRYRNHLRKLTNRQVIRIRSLYASGKFLHRDLSNKFGISKAAVSMICCGITYQDSGGPVTRRQITI